MSNSNSYRMELERELPIQLSSDWTKFIVIGSVVVGVLGSLFVFLVFDRSKGTPTTQFIGTIGLIAIVGLVIYQLVIAAEAVLVAKNLTLNKIIGKEYDINVDDIEKLSSFSTRRIKYTFIRFVDDEGKTQRALILNSNSFIYGKEDTAIDIIKEAQSL
jgi:hypothetical protein